jgi:regulator of replication initiation timing
MMNANRLKAAMEVSELKRKINRLKFEIEELNKTTWDLIRENALLSEENKRLKGELDARGR